jgi:hypothetical protein
MLPEIRRECTERDAVEGGRAFAEDMKSRESFMAVIVEVDGPDVLQAGRTQGA